jgi:hypothetical protein
MSLLKALSMGHSEGFQLFSILGGSVGASPKMLTKKKMIADWLDRMVGSFGLLKVLEISKTELGALRMYEAVAVRRKRCVKLTSD